MREVEKLWRIQRRLCEVRDIFVKTCAGDHFAAMLTLQTQGNGPYSPTGCLVFSNNIIASRLF